MPSPSHSSRFYHPHNIGWGVLWSQNNPEVNYSPTRISGRWVGGVFLGETSRSILDALISQIYFWNKTLQVSDSSSVHHQEFFTVHTAMAHVIPVKVTACEQDQDGTAVPSWSCSQAVSKPVCFFAQVQTGSGLHSASCTIGRLRFKCDGTCKEIRFRFSAKRTSPFKS